MKGRVRLPATLEDIFAAALQHIEMQKEEFLRVCQRAKFCDTKSPYSSSPGPACDSGGVTATSVAIWRALQKVILATIE